MQQPPCYTTELSWISIIPLNGVVLQDELVHLRTAQENNREYTLNDLHDPVRLLFDNTFKFGTSVMFPEFMMYNLPTEPDERSLDIKLVSAGYDNVGALEVRPSLRQHVRSRACMSFVCFVT